PRRGGIIENVYMRNVTVGDVADAVVRIFMFYANETGDNYPIVRNVQVKNVTSKKSKYGILIEADPDHPVEGMYLEKWSLENVSEGNSLKGYENLELKKVKGKGGDIKVDYTQCFRHCELERWRCERVKQAALGFRFS